LDDNLEQQLFDVIHKDIIIDLIRSFDSDHKMRIVDSSENIVDTIYWDEYRTDQLLQVAGKDRYPHGKPATDMVFLSNVEFMQGEMGQTRFPFLRESREVITFYLENIPHVSYFTYVRMLVENDEIILEPIDRTAPILIKGLNNIPNIKFRCPDWYKGYVKAVDCSPYVIRELFKDFQVIFEKTILQPLPR
jgi:hypothetical protein